MNNVTDKVILVTGASSGIGEATARLLAANGAKVVMGARRTDKLDEIAKEIRWAGGTAEALSVDVRNPQSVQAMADFALEKFGRIDVMFNNAGIMPLSPMADMKTTEWNDMIDINIKGVLNGVAAVLPTMHKQGYGQIINTGSIGSHLVAPTSAVYSATKFAVHAITEGLRQESPMLRIMLLSPGVTTTELGHDISHAETSAALTEWRKASLPPEAIANAVLYAISQPANVEINEIILRATNSVF